MKRTLPFICMLIGITSFGQTISLNWKIGAKEKLNYLTVMSDIDTSNIEVNFGELFKSLSDSSGKKIATAQELFKQLNKAMQNVDYISTLTNKGNGIIDIVMAARQKEENKEASKKSADSTGKAMLKLMQVMNQGVVLRGEVYAGGGIHSFWVKSNQKNLVATLFELPSKPVKVGDTWKLDINLISNDQNFSCDSSYKINEVTLTDIKVMNGETIAVIKYNIAEYVKGTFNTSGFMSDGGAKKTIMKLTHQAIAEFSVDRGRWISYNGIMSLEASGIMTANKKTKFALLNE